MWRHRHRTVTTALSPGVAALVVAFRAGKNLHAIERRDIPEPAAWALIVAGAGPGVVPKRVASRALVVVQEPLIGVLVLFDRHGNPIVLPIT